MVLQTILKFRLQYVRSGKIHLSEDDGRSKYPLAEGCMNSQRYIRGCRYSKSIFKDIGDWCVIQLPEEESIQWWLRYRERSATKKKIVGIILATCIYMSWHARNVAKIELLVWKKEIVTRRIKNDVIRRIKSLDLKTECISTRSWIERLKMGGTG